MYPCTLSLLLILPRELGETEATLGARGVRFSGIQTGGNPGRCLPWPKYGEQVGYSEPRSGARLAASCTGDAGGRRDPQDHLRLLRL